MPEKDAIEGRTPRWVKVFGIIALVVIVLVVIMLVTGRGGGGHGPGRHSPGGEGSGGHTGPPGGFPHPQP